MKSAMSLSRFEAFSDGVFAIAHQSPDALPFTQSMASNDATELPDRVLATARLAQRLATLLLRAAPEPVWAVGN